MRIGQINYDVKTVEVKRSKSSKSLLLSRSNSTEQDIQKINDSLLMCLNFGTQLLVII